MPLKRKRGKRGSPAPSNPTAKLSPKKSQRLSQSGSRTTPVIRRSRRQTPNSPLPEIEGTITPDSNINIEAESGSDNSACDATYLEKDLAASGEETGIQQEIEQCSRNIDEEDSNIQQNVDSHEIVDEDKDENTSFSDCTENNNKSESLQNIATKGPYIILEKLDSNVCVSKVNEDSCSVTNEKENLKVEATSTNMDIENIDETVEENFTSKTVCEISQPTEKFNIDESSRAEKKLGDIDQFPNDLPIENVPVSTEFLVKGNSSEDILTGLNEKGDKLTSEETNLEMEDNEKKTDMLIDNELTKTSELSVCKKPSEENTVCGVSCVKKELTTLKLKPISIQEDAEENSETIDDGGSFLGFGQLNPNVDLNIGKVNFGSANYGKCEETADSAEHCEETADSAEHCEETADSAEHCEEPANSAEHCEETIKIENTDAEGSGNILMKLDSNIGESSVENVCCIIKAEENCQELEENSTDVNINNVAKPVANLSSAVCEVVQPDEEVNIKEFSNVIEEDVDGKITSVIHPGSSDMPVEKLTISSEFLVKSDTNEDILTDLGENVKFQSENDLSLENSNKKTEICIGNEASKIEHLSANDSSELSGSKKDSEENNADGKSCIQTELEALEVPTIQEETVKVGKNIEGDEVFLGFVHPNDELSKVESENIYESDCSKNNEGPFIILENLECSVTENTSEGVCSPTKEKESVCKLEASSFTENIEETDENLEPNEVCESEKSKTELSVCKQVSDVHDNSEGENSVRTTKDNRAEMGSLNIKPIEEEPTSRKKITKIVWDIPLSSEEKHLNEVTGTEFPANAEYSRVVLVGDSYIRSFAENWPIGCDYKPYFIWKKMITFDILTKLINNHSFLRKHKNMLIIVFLGLTDMIQFKYLKKCKKCEQTHPKIKMAIDIKKAGVVKRMVDLKVAIEKCCKGSFVAFSDLPAFNFVNNADAIFDMMNKSCGCQCKFQFKESTQSFCDTDISRINQHIFNKKFACIKKSQYFRFSQIQVVFNPSDGEWKIPEEKQQNLTCQLSNRLNALVRKHTNLNHEAFQSHTKMCVFETPKNLDCPVYVIADRWLLSICKKWDFSYSNVSPLFTVIDWLNLDRLKTFIESTVLPDEPALIISSIGLEHLVTFKSFRGCEGHAPLSFPVPNKDLLDDYVSFTNRIQEKMEDLQEFLSQNRKKCKLLYMTCYPMVFRSYYEYLIELHNKRYKHPIKVEELIDRDIQMRVNSALEHIDKKIVHFNAKYGLHTCHISAIAKEVLSSKHFIFPLYVQQRTPPNILWDKLMTLIKGYLESIAMLIEQQSFTFDDTSQSQLGQIDIEESSASVHPSCFRDDLIITIKNERAKNKTEEKKGLEDGVATDAGKDMGLGNDHGKAGLKDEGGKIKGIDNDIGVKMKVVKSGYGKSKGVKDELVKSTAVNDILVGKWLKDTKLNTGRHNDNHGKTKVRQDNISSKKKEEDTGKAKKKENDRSKIAQKKNENDRSKIAQKKREETDHGASKRKRDENSGGNKKSKTLPVKHGSISSREDKNPKKDVLEKESVSTLPTYIVTSQVSDTDDSFDLNMNDDENRKKRLIKRTRDKFKVDRLQIPTCKNKDENIATQSSSYPNEFISEENYTVPIDGQYEPVSPTRLRFTSPLRVKEQLTRKRERVRDSAEEDIELQDDTNKRVCAYGIDESIPEPTNDLRCTITRTDEGAISPVIYCEPLSPSRDFGLASPERDLRYELSQKSTGYPLESPPHDRRFKSKRLGSVRSRLRSPTRSPFRKRSRSPFKKRSRSPFRKRSRSPFKKRSRSPFRKRSRSPFRRRRSPSYSRSNLSKYSHENYDRKYRSHHSPSGSRSRSYKRSPKSRDRYPESVEDVAVKNLLEIHEKECVMYRQRPDVHPDFNKERRQWMVANQAYYYGYPLEMEMEWNNQWLFIMERIFSDNWTEKKDRCLSLLSDKNASRSHSSPSRKRSTKKTRVRIGKGQEEDQSTSPTNRTLSMTELLSHSTSAYMETMSGYNQMSIESADQQMMSMNELENKIEAFMKKTSNTNYGLAASTSTMESILSVAKSTSDETLTASSVLEVTSILDQISDKFGPIGISMKTLHLKISEAVSSKVTNFLSCIDDDGLMLLKIIHDKLSHALSEGKLSIVQKAISREAQEKLKKLLDALKEKDKPHFGLDINTIAAANRGKDFLETVKFIKNALAYSNVQNVAEEEIMNIYIAVKSAQEGAGSHSQNLNPPSYSGSIEKLIKSTTESHTAGDFETGSILSKLSQKTSKRNQIEEEFEKLSTSEKIGKYSNFNKLKFEEKSVLLSYLEKVEEDDQQLAQLLRYMIMKNKSVSN